MVFSGCTYFFLDFKLDSHKPQSHPPAPKHTLSVWKKLYADMDGPLPNMKSVDVKVDEKARFNSVHVIAIQKTFGLQLI